MTIYSRSSCTLGPEDLFTRCQIPSWDDVPSRPILGRRDMAAIKWLKFLALLCVAVRAEQMQCIHVFLCAWHIFLLFQKLSSSAYTLMHFQPWRTGCVLWSRDECQQFRRWAGKWTQEKHDCLVVNRAWKCDPHRNRNLKFVVMSAVSWLDYSFCVYLTCFIYTWKVSEKTALEVPETVSYFWLSWGTLEETRRNLWVAFYRVL